MRTFKAYRVHRAGDKTIGRLEQIGLDDLNPGELVIKTAYSSINYKDALGGLGRGKIYKRFPIVAGIDASGTVESSEDKRFKSGDQVLVTGCEFGESYDGGYAQYVRVSADKVVKIPSGLSTYEAMALGTAGFTAALATHRMKQNGQTPDKGPILVTGASGGVGSIAINIFSTLGYEVHACSGKENLKDFLKKIGAKEVLSLTELNLGSRPLENARWGGVVDNVGGDLLGRLLPHVALWGNVASIGLAGGSTLQATVMPFILRGVSLLGVSSNNCTMELRQELWQHLASDLKPSKLKDIVQKEVRLEDLDGVFQEMLDRKTFGRIVVKI